jgi:hypothetical protein
MSMAFKKFKVLVILFKRSILGLTKSLVKANALSILRTFKPN